MENVSKQKPRGRLIIIGTLRLVMYHSYLRCTTICIHHTLRLFYILYFIRIWPEHRRAYWITIICGPFINHSALNLGSSAYALLRYMREPLFATL